MKKTLIAALLTLPLLSPSGAHAEFGKEFWMQFDPSAPKAASAAPEVPQHSFLKPHTGSQSDTMWEGPITGGEQGIYCRQVGMRSGAVSTRCFGSGMIKSTNKVPANAKVDWQGYRCVIGNIPLSYEEQQICRARYW